MFTAEQPTLLLKKKTHFFEQGMFWGPQALFMPGQAAADSCFEKQHAFFQKGLLWSKTYTNL